MSRERKLILAIEVVRALLELSRAGMVHLDWKPANVLVTTKAPHSPLLMPLTTHIQLLRARPTCHICAGTGLAPATSAPGLGPTAQSADLRKSKPSEPLLKLIDFGEAAIATVHMRLQQSIRCCNKVSTVGL